MRLALLPLLLAGCGPFSGTRNLFDDAYFPPRVAGGPDILTDAAAWTVDIPGVVRVTPTGEPTRSTTTADTAEDPDALTRWWKAEAWWIVDHHASFGDFAPRDGVQALATVFSDDGTDVITGWQLVVSLSEGFAATLIYDGDEVVELRIEDALSTAGGVDRWTR